MSRRIWLAVLFLILVLYAIHARGEDPYLDLPVDPKDPPVVVPPPVATVTTVISTAPQPPRPKAPPPLVTTAPPVPTEVPPTIYGRDLHSENGTIVYVLDISGSMQGERLTKAKAELVRSLGSLPVTFRFGLIAYDCYVYDFGASLIPATTENRKRGQAWVDERQTRNDGTGTGPAVHTALRLYSQARLVVLLTDGEPNCGAGDGMGGPSCLDAHLSQIESGNADRHAEIDVFGISATGTWRDWLVKVAARNRGQYRDVR